MDNAVSLRLVEDDAVANFENGDEQEAADASYERLLKATREQLLRGPKGLSTDSGDDSWEQWQRTAIHVSRGILSVEDLMPDILPLVWCRIYLSVVNTNPENPNIPLIHYSFHNLSDEVLPLNLSDTLFRIRRRIRRHWLTEDVTSGEKRDNDGELAGVSGSGDLRRIKPNLLLSPSHIATVTDRGHSDPEGGIWVSHFGKCLPSHTYKFQLIYGGLPSNVFTWTAPE